MSLYNAAQVFDMIRTISQTYLRSIQYDVTIEEEDDHHNTEISKISIEMFLLKMMAKEMCKHGSNPTDLSKIMNKLDISHIAHPDNKSVTVFTYIPIRLHGPDSKTPVER